MRRLRALIYGLPAESVFRHSVATADATPTPAAGRRRASSADDIRKAGGKVIEIRRDRTA